jgi:predicted kinase
MMVDETESIAAAAFQDIIDSNPVYSFEGSGPKRLLIMSGLPLSGKTYFVNMMNHIRPGKFQQINSHTTRPVAVKFMGRKRPTYDKTEHRITFEVAHRLMQRVLLNNWPVIADATNLSERYRAWAVDAGREASAEMLLVFMQVSDETANKRLNERTSESSATFSTYQQLKYDLESFDKCSVPYLIIDSEVDISPHAGTVAKWLCGELDAIPNVRYPKHA